MILPVILFIVLTNTYLTLSEVLEFEGLSAKDINEIILNKTKCSTVNCVRSSALVLQKLNLKVNPCDDFYDFACGGQKYSSDNVYTGDTWYRMYEEMIEYFLTILEHPDEKTVSKQTHKYAQIFFESCMDTQKIDKIELKPLKMMVNAVGGWPLLEGDRWKDETFIGWEQQILAFRKYVNNATEHIFDIKTSSRSVKNEKVQSFYEEDKSYNEIFIQSLNEQLIKIIDDIVVRLGGTGGDSIRNEIQDFLKFDRDITEYQEKFKRFKKKYKRTKKPLEKMKRIYKIILYLDILDSSIYKNRFEFDDDKITTDFNEKYVKFVDSTSNRTIANFVFWRFLQASLPFLDSKVINAIIDFNIYVGIDAVKRERRIYCVEEITKIAPVAAGLIYIDSSFSAEKQNAINELVDYVIKAYNEAALNSDWMDEKTRKEAIDTVNKMHRSIGYHPKMREPEGFNFYNKMPLYTDHADYMKMGLGFRIFHADYKFVNELTRQSGSDWTVYESPAAVNAQYYILKNTMQLSLGILQSPNFDVDRPASFNFGAIGSIIAHEITHSFVNQTKNVDLWDNEMKIKYKNELKCLVDQYSNTRVPEIENFNGDGKAVYLNGNKTLKEDKADNAGIKIAHKAWQLYMEDHKEMKLTSYKNDLISGIDFNDEEKMFWLSYTLYFCIVEHPKQMKYQINSDEHSLNKFRVNIPLKNSREFSKAWNCPLGSPMNPERKCTVW